MSISDGYHTLDELYEHRHALFCALLGASNQETVKSKLHHDGTSWPGWFLAGIRTPEGWATYHLPDTWWDRCPAPEADRGPEWDGHTSDDVLRRLQSLL